MSLPQRRARPLQRAVDRRHGRVEQVGDLRRLPVQDLAQDQHRALARRQVLQGRDERQAECHARLATSAGSVCRLTIDVGHRLQPRRSRPASRSRPSTDGRRDPSAALDAAAPGTSSRQTFVAMRYSHDRNDERPSKRSKRATPAPASPVPRPRPRTRRPACGSSSRSAHRDTARAAPRSRRARRLDGCGRLEFGHLRVTPLGARVRASDGRRSAGRDRDGPRARAAARHVVAGGDGVVVRRAPAQAGDPQVDVLAGARDVDLAGPAAQPLRAIEVARGADRARGLLDEVAARRAASSRRCRARRTSARPPSPTERRAASRSRARACGRTSDAVAPPAAVARSGAGRARAPRLLR